MGDTNRREFIAVVCGIAIGARAVLKEEADPRTAWPFYKTTRGREFTRVANTPTAFSHQIGQDVAVGMRFDDPPGEGVYAVYLLGPDQTRENGQLVAHVLVDAHEQTQAEFMLRQPPRHWRLWTEFRPAGAKDD